MSSRVRQDGLLGRGRTGESDRVNETPRNYDRLKFRLLVLSFVYFGERPVFIVEIFTGVSRRNHHSVGILHLLKNPEKYSLSIVREGAKQFFSVQDE